MDGNDQLTPEEENALAQAQAQQQIAQQQAMAGMGGMYNSGMYDMAAQQEIQNTRQFYLNYKELLNDTVRTWRGEVETEDGWKKMTNPLMNEEAILKLSSMLRDFLSTAVRLSNYEPKYVNLYAFQARKHISKWLHTVGWQKFSVPIENLNMISFRCGQLIHASLNWAKNGGGQKFMTTSIRSIENVSQVYAEQMKGQNAGVSDSQLGGGKSKFFKFPKIW